MKYIDITIDYCLYLPTFFVANSAVIKKSEVLRVVPIRYKPIEDGINYQITKRYQKKRHNSGYF